MDRSTHNWEEDLEPRRPVRKEAKLSIRLFKKNAGYVKTAEITEKEH